MEGELFVVVSEDQPWTGTAKQVIDAIDMSDCVHVEAVYRVIVPGGFHGDGSLERLQIHGPWHSDDPLYIKVTDSKGEIVCDGFGTDH